MLYFLLFTKGTGLCECSICYCLLREPVCVMAIVVSALVLLLCVYAR